MRSILIDIETCPLLMAELEAIMPDELKNPIMPDEIANPGDPDLSKCPKYGGDMGKQAEWQEKTAREWNAKAEAAKQNWSLKQMDAKNRFIDNAALDASTGEVKLIGLWDVEGDARIIHAVDADSIRIEEGAYPFGVTIERHDSEAEMLRYLFPSLKYDFGTGEARLIGYNIESFDLPFIYRRAWKLGILPPHSLRKGRYWNDDYVCDLRAVYQLGDRQYKMGGLDGLAKVLGTKRKKGDGKMFWQMWRDDPVAAINYNLDELEVIYEVAKKLGVI